MWKFKGKWEGMGFAGLRYADAVTASAVAAGAYRMALDGMGLPLDLSKPNAAAIEQATLLLRRTQSSPFFKDVGLAISHGGLSGNVSVDKAILQFQSFMLNRWSLIEHDIYQAKFKSGNKLDAAWATYFLAMATLVETGIRRGTKYFIGSVLAGLGLTAVPDRDRDPFLEDWLRQVLQVVPFASDLAGLSGYKTSPVPLLAGAQDMASAGPAVKAAWKGRPESAIRNTVKALGGLAGLAGVPGTAQASQLVMSMIGGRRLHFPYSGELADLRELRRKGKLTGDESMTLNRLGRAESVFKAHNERFKRAMARGDMKSAREAAEKAYEAMGAFK